ncbi:hypothetical protein [Nocardioides montaniterrae]
MAREERTRGRWLRRSPEPASGAAAGRDEESAAPTQETARTAEQASAREQPRTHLGPRFDALVAAAVGRQRPAGERPGYDRIRERMDVGHYLLQAAHLLNNPDIEPVRNLLRQGSKARVNPEINFSADAYLKRHPERAEERSPYLAWLQRGRAAGEIADPAIGIERMADVLGMTTLELADELGARRTDLQQRLRHGRLGEVWAAAAQVEPLIADAWVETTRPKMTPLPIGPVAHQVSALHDCHRAAEFRRATLVLVIGAVDQPDGRELLTAMLDQVAATEVVVVVTDEPVPSDADVPAGVRLLDLATAVAPLNRDPAERVLVEVLRSLCARAILGARSEMLLDVMTPYGKALRATERVFLTLEGLTTDVLGPRGDALRFYYRHVDAAAGFLAMDPAIAGQVGELYQTPEDARSLVHAAYDDTTRAAAVSCLLEETTR